LGEKEQAVQNEQRGKPDEQVPSDGAPVHIVIIPVRCHLPAAGMK
jgi:hypothetical protein